MKTYKKYNIKPYIYALLETTVFLLVIIVVYVGINDIMGEPFKSPSYTTGLIHGLVTMHFFKKRYRSYSNS
jgi:hypothetical protein